MSNSRSPDGLALYDVTNNGSTGTGRPRQPRYRTQEDAETVQKAKRIHKETTASAQRALQVLPFIFAYVDILWLTT